MLTLLIVLYLVLVVALICFYWQFMGICGVNGKGFKAVGEFMERQERINKEFRKILDQIPLDPPFTKGGGEN